MKSRLPLVPVLAALAVGACAPTTLPPDEATHRAAALHLKEAGKETTAPEQRAALYLDAAREAAGLLDSPSSGDEARLVYNAAAVDLTVLLRTAGGGSLWNRPLTLRSENTTYRLRYGKRTGEGFWDPAYFTAFTPAAEVDLKTIKRHNRIDGIGGALVGVRKTDPLEPFSPRVGIAAPVTSILDFKGSDVTLSLVDPEEKTKARLAGRERALEADFSAPLAYYPQRYELWEGLMGAIRVTQHMNITGLYMLQPYDPDRIPLIFVHGLISTPQMWRNVINELETDPVLRGRYQCWAFAYPTGNPPAYSALRLREELAKVHDLHPDARNYVLVGHSMGGILSRMQVTTVNRQAWDVIGKDKARQFFANVEKGGLVDRATAFEANPNVDRAIFICTPHRGSEMAVGGIGDLAVRLIALPVDLASAVTKSAGGSLAIVTGDPKRLPTSVDGLSPNNPAHKVLDARPIEVPHHTIAGDRGRGDAPNSSDGVVKYWSSRLQTAKSEKIVPGPHGACELPETIDELRRLLHLHLREKDGGRGSR